MSTKNEPEKALKRMFRRWISGVIHLAETHCGHESKLKALALALALASAEVDFEGWFLAMMRRSERNRWYYLEGVEDGKKGKGIEL